MKVRLARYIAFGVGTALITMPVAAQQRGGGKKVRAACEADFKRLCPGIGRKEMRSCVSEKAGELSGGCKDALQQMRGERRAAREAASPPSQSSSATSKTSTQSTPPNE